MVTRQCSGGGGAAYSGGVGPARPPSRPRAAGVSRWPAAGGGGGHPGRCHGAETGAASAPAAKLSAEIDLILSIYSEAGGMQSARLSPERRRAGRALEPPQPLAPRDPLGRLSPPFLGHSPTALSAPGGAHWPAGGSGGGLSRPVSLGRLTPSPVDMAARRGSYCNIDCTYCKYHTAASPACSPLRSPRSPCSECLRGLVFMPSVYGMQSSRWIGSIKPCFVRVLSIGIEQRFV